MEPSVDRDPWHSTSFTSNGVAIRPQRVAKRNAAYVPLNADRRPSYLGGRYRPLRRCSTSDILS